jgi:pyocin large subunit-like protein
MQDLLTYIWDLVRRFLKSESKMMLEEVDRKGTEFSKKGLRELIKRVSTFVSHQLGVEFCTS